MKKIVLVNGLIAGLIANGIIITSISTGYSGDYGMVIGYASMLLAFSLVFVAIKSYRDKYNGGLISFGKAFRIGLYIVLIASTIYVAAWLVEYFFFVPDYAEKYVAQMLEKLKASGATQAELDKTTKEMASFAKMYKNPFFNAMITYTEILPVGLIVTLISSLILKRKQKTSSGTAIA